VRTDGKLQALAGQARPGRPAGPVDRIHIEQGWENALEAALRERMGALEVSRLDMVRAFANDAPPARWPSTPTRPPVPEAAGTLPRWPTCCA
jgi:chromosome segregation protein